MHIGSQITDLEPFGEAFGLVAELVAVLRADGHAIDHVDLGGGLGIPYREGEDPDSYHPDRYAAIVRKHADALGCRLVFEPGRLIVGNAGILVTEVLYVKAGEAKTFVIVDAAMNDLVRPTLYDAHHEVKPVMAPPPGGRGSSPMSSARSARPAIIWRSAATCRRSRPAISWRSCRPAPMGRSRPAPIIRGCWCRKFWSRADVLHWCGHAAATTT